MSLSIAPLFSDPLPETSDFGVLAMICSIAHGACHVARFAYESVPEVLVRNTINRSGLAALLLLVAAALPMSVGFVKDKVRRLILPFCRLPLFGLLEWQTWRARIPWTLGPTPARYA